MRPGAPTIDGLPKFRAMAVGLTSEQEAACKKSIVPVPLVRARDVAEACSSMSTILPLIVVVDEGITDADRDALVEYTTACGAEIVAIEHTPDARLAKRLFDAIVVAERRRMGAQT